jgi:hypothetical protein
MWQLYGHKGVAIQSTIGDLKKAMANSGVTRRLIARVRYRRPKASYLSVADAIFDPENKTSWPPWLMRPYLFKRPSYEYEEEIRFVFGIDPILARLPRGGIEVLVDGKALVQKVLVSQLIPHSERLLIEEMSKKIKAGEILIPKLEPEDREVLSRFFTAKDDDPEFYPDLNDYPRADG